jgi:phenylalanyl-tRNA synthetase beta chain
LKLSLNWIQDFIDITDLPLDTVLQKINSSICETEEALPYLPHLKTIIPVRVLKLEPHPQADKLQIAIVTDGKKEIQIVTGAKNIAINDTIPLALPGTKLGDKEIQVSSLRGVESSGMLCSEKELGIGDGDSGVMVLDKSYTLGLSLAAILNTDDIIIDIDNKSITHRPDLWSHFGFARELASQFSLKIKNDPLLDFSWDAKLFQNQLTDIKIINNSNTHGYFATSISDVQILDSNWKIKSRLLRCGFKSISNVVDVSNYLLLECGQPTHFFDRDKLPGLEFEASFSKFEEKISLLDGTNPLLEEGILLIRCKDQPVAIAGVMGGLDSSVTSTTKNLVLESAIFKREDIRKSIRKTGIRSDASIRYEKGLDNFTCLPVMRRAIQLLQENGCPTSKAYLPSGFDNNSEKKITIHVDVNFIQKKLGKKLPEKDIIEILNRLNFKVEAKEQGKLEILVPWYRHNYDVTIAEDLVEEIGRTIGYASIHTNPLELAVQIPIENSIRILERKLKSAFAWKLGYNEVFNYSFASMVDARFEEEIEDLAVVQLKNEMPPEHSVLRTSMYPSLLKNTKTNQDRFETFGLFEVGRTYKNLFKDGDGLPREDRELGFIFLNEGRLQNENKSQLEKDLIDVRESAIFILKDIGLKDIKFEMQSKKYMHPNGSLTLSYKNEVIGEVGILHSREVDLYGLRKRPIIGKLNITKLKQILADQDRKSKFFTPSAFPQGQLDISIITNILTSSSEYANLLLKQNIPELEQVWVHDTFSGGNIEPGNVSITYRVNLISYEKTFTQERLKEISDLMVATAKDAGYKMR